MTMSVRRLLGRLLPHCGYGQCQECGRPWWAVNDRASTRIGVYFTESASAYALCRPCWDDLEPLGRFAAFSRLVDMWERQDEEFGRAEPRDPSIDVIRDRFAKAILVHRDPRHWAHPILRRPVPPGAPPPWYRARR